VNTGPRRIYRICKRVLYFEEGKAGKYGRGDEEEMKDQLALLRKLAKGVVWCSVYTCVHAGVLTPYVRRLLCVYAQRVLAIFSFFIFIVIIIPAPFSLFLSMAESGGIPDGYSGGSVSTCLLYCCVRVFVWWYGACVLKLVSSTYV